MPGSAWEIPQATLTGLLNGADSEAGRSWPREPAASSLPGPAEAGEDGPFSSVTGQTTRLGSEPRLQSRLTGPPRPPRCPPQHGERSADGSSLERRCRRGDPRNVFCSQTSRF